eukprot:360195-Chlamydomonas_euryale.AAC.2
MLAPSASTLPKPNTGRGGQAPPASMDSDSWICAPKVAWSSPTPFSKTLPPPPQRGTATPVLTVPCWTSSSCAADTGRGSPTSLPAAPSPPPSTSHQTMPSLPPAFSHTSPWLGQPRDPPAAKPPPISILHRLLSPTLLPGLGSLEILPQPSPPPYPYFTAWLKVESVREAYVQKVKEQLEATPFPTPHPTRMQSLHAVSPQTLSHLPLHHCGRTSALNR